MKWASNRLSQNSIENESNFMKNMVADKRLVNAKALEVRLDQSLSKDDTSYRSCT